MKLRLFVAHFAEIQQGMLYALGTGWTEIGPAPSPFSIAALVEVSWEETNRKYRLEFTIEDGDGKPFKVQTPTGEQPFMLTADFEVGRPPGAKPGRSFLLPVAINVMPLPFEPGQSYLLKARIDDRVYDETAFVVRAPDVRQQPVR